MKYLIEEIDLMLKGSIYRSSIDEQWIYQLLFHFIFEENNQSTIDFSLILSNDYNTDDIHFNYFIEIHSLVDIQLTFKQLSQLIQSCVMTKNSEICLKFIESSTNG